MTSFAKDTAAVPLKPETQAESKCAYCGKSGTILFARDKCDTALFCDEKCRAAASSKHPTECGDSSVDAVTVQKHWVPPDAAASKRLHQLSRAWQERRFKTLALVAVWCRQQGHLACLLRLNADQHVVLLKPFTAITLAQHYKDQPSKVAEQLGLIRKDKSNFALYLEFPAALLADDEASKSLTASAFVVVTIQDTPAFLHMAQHGGFDTSAFQSMLNSPAVI